MADDEDVVRIRQGVAAWNEWRAHNPYYPMDLSGGEPRRGGAVAVYFHTGIAGQRRLRDCDSAALSVWLSAVSHKRSFLNSR
jgi:hypothetical protein